VNKVEHDYIYSGIMDGEEFCGHWNGQILGMSLFGVSPTVACPTDVLQVPASDSPDGGELSLPKTEATETGDLMAKADQKHLMAKAEKHWMDEDMCWFL
jgi:hypothetical protein